MAGADYAEQWFSITGDPLNTVGFKISKRIQVYLSKNHSVCVNDAQRHVLTVMDGPVRYKELNVVVKWDEAIMGILGAVWSDADPKKLAFFISCYAFEDGKRVGVSDSRLAVFSSWLQTAIDEDLIPVNRVPELASIVKT